MTDDERTQRRADDIERVKMLVCQPRHIAAKWLARWLIAPDVRRGLSLHEIMRGALSRSGSLGTVSIYGHRIIVIRVGPSASPAWSDYPPGYEVNAEFSLDRIYAELRREFFAPRQMWLWAETGEGDRANG